MPSPLAARLGLPNRNTEVKNEFLRVHWCYCKITTYRTIQATNSKAEEIDGVDLQAGERWHIKFQLPYFCKYEALLFLLKHTSVGGHAGCSWKYVQSQDHRCTSEGTVNHPKRQKTAWWWQFSMWIWKLLLSAQEKLRKMCHITFNLKLTRYDSIFSHYNMHQLYLGTWSPFRKRKLLVFLLFIALYFSSSLQKAVTYNRRRMNAFFFYYYISGHSTVRH